MRSTSGGTTPRSKSARTEAPSALETQQAPSDPKGPASDETREAMVRLVAYRFYERRGFVSGSELQDWLEAEMEVDRQLAQATAEPQSTGHARTDETSAAATAQRPARKTASTSRKTRNT